MNLGLHVLEGKILKIYFSICSLQVYILLANVLLIIVSINSFSKAALKIDQFDNTDSIAFK